MRTFLISYDVAAPSSRHAINSAIMMLGTTWARPLSQTWYIRADLDRSDIEPLLSGFLADDDALVIQLVEDEASLANTTLRWFKQRPLSERVPNTNVVAFPVITDRPQPEPTRITHTPTANVA